MKIPKFALPQLVVSIKGDEENRFLWNGASKKKSYAVEVLTVNFNSGSMRVRSTDGSFIGPVDIDAKWFFDQYAVVKRA
jgi:hypothetical protein